jgi:transposase
MELYVGIDVAKKSLEVALSSGEQWSCANDAQGIAQLTRRLVPLEPALVVMEASGGYERELSVALCAAGVEVRVINPRQTHHFARALGEQAKTDRIDAQMLARFAQSVEPKEQMRAEPEREELKELVQRRQQLLTMLTAERNRRGRAPKWLRGSIDRTIRALERELGAIDHRIADKLEGSAQLKAVGELISTVPGVGRVLSATVIARLPELGRLSRREIAALVGVAPFVRQSGTWRGAATIAGGRSAVRSALYMAALAGIRHNPVVRAFYRQLRERGKPAKVALVAAMRKLLLILNAMLKSNTPWRPPCPAAS